MNESLSRGKHLNLLVVTSTLLLLTLPLRSVVQLFPIGLLARRDAPLLLTQTALPTGCIVIVVDIIIATAVLALALVRTTAVFVVG